MPVGNVTIYIKGNSNVEVSKLDVTLGDLLAIECTNKNILSRLKVMKILKIPHKGTHRYVISVLKIIEKIHEEYPTVEIQNLGPSDLIVTYEKQEKKNKWIYWGKVIVVIAITFFGAAYSIMAFNNDVSTTKMFGQIYEQVMGREKNGFTILELTYSIGIAIGIIIFFNHFGKKKFSVDPTPIEVEMRLYENDIQTTLIDESARKGQEIDVH